MSKQHKVISKKSEEEAFKIAMGIQRPEQTKEQTKLIAQGISKGIELYKKQQKAKAREYDKNRKKALKNPNNSESDDEAESVNAIPDNRVAKLPWILLGLSWLGFIVYVALGRHLMG